MNRASWLWSWGAVVVVGSSLVAGCQAIAKLESRTVDDIKTGCSLPEAGNARVRIVNVAAVAGNADFCMRTSGASSWGRPIFRDGGDDSLCRTGLEYGQATVAFAAPVGSIDVKAIPAGSTCAAAATSEVDGVAVGDATSGGAVVTLVRWGGGSSAEAIAALSEYVSGAVGIQAHYRMANVMSGGKSVNFGIADEKALPAKIASPINATPVDPGHVLPPGSSDLVTVDANGYAAILGSSFNFAAAYADDSSSSAIALQPSRSGADNASLYLIGDPSDPTNAHPTRFLTCEENPAVNASTTDSGAPDNAQGDDLKLLSSCVLSPLKTLSVDTVSVGLYGLSAPFYTQRAQVIPSRLAARTSDVMCIVEADDVRYRNAIVAAAAAGTGTGNFPNAYLVDTTQATPFSDPDDARPAPSVPPCGGSVSADTVNAAYQCLIDNCATGTDPTTAVLNESTNCVSQRCALQLAKLLHPGKVPSDGANIAADQTCLNCIIASVNDGTTLGTSKTNCTTLSQDQFTFNGQTSTMILSRYPLTSTKYYVLPSTVFRRTVLKAQVQLEDQKVDFFCTQLSGPTVPLLVYTGNYGKSSNNPPENGWEDEQVLQAKRAIAWMKSEADTDGLPAVITGDWDATVGTTNADGGVGLTSTSPEVPPLFDQQYGAGGPFTLAVPPGYVPVCDYCTSNQNPYNTQTETYQLHRTYTYNFPTNAALSETLWGTTPDIPLQKTDFETPPPGGLGNISEYFPHNVVLLRPH